MGTVGKVREGPRLDIFGDAGRGNFASPETAFNKLTYDTYKGSASV